MNWNYSLNQKILSSSNLNAHQSTYTMKSTILMLKQFYRKAYIYATPQKSVCTKFFSMLHGIGSQKMQLNSNEWYSQKSLPIELHRKRQVRFLIIISTCFINLKLQKTYGKGLHTKSPKSDYKVGFWQGSRVQVLSFISLLCLQFISNYYQTL